MGRARLFLVRYYAEGEFNRGTGYVCVQDQLGSVREVATWQPWRRADLASAHLRAGFKPNG